MKKIIKFILYMFLGTVISLVLALLSDKWHMLLTCGIVGFCVWGFLFACIPESSLKKIIAIVAAIVAFFLYMILYSYINNKYSGGNIIFPILVFIVPYAFISYLIVEMSE